MYMLGGCQSGSNKFIFYFFAHRGGGSPPGPPDLDPRVHILYPNMMWTVRSIYYPYSRHALNGVQSIHYNNKPTYR